MGVNYIALLVGSSPKQMWRRGRRVETRGGAWRCVEARCRNSDPAGVDWVRALAGAIAAVFS